MSTVTLPLAERVIRNTFPALIRSAHQLVDLPVEEIASDTVLYYLDLEDNKLNRNACELIASKLRHPSNV